MRALLSIVVLYICFRRFGTVRLLLNGAEGDMKTINAAIAVRETEVAAKAVLAARPCVVVDGDVCHCYEASFEATVVRWEGRCASIRVQAASLERPISVAMLLRTDSQLPMSGVSASRTISTSPVHVFKDGVETQPGLITLVLPLTVDDLDRASILLFSLQKCARGVVKELLVFTPALHASIIGGAFNGLARKLSLPFEINVHAETTLFGSAKESLQRYYPYAIQMAVKLLAARMVRTPYYLTLDADVVFLRPFTMENLLFAGDSSTGGKALYHWEDRRVHEAWWKGSERVLNVSAATSYRYAQWQEMEQQQASCTVDAAHGEGCDAQGTGTQHAVQGYGVTPALLSTYGSLLTVSHLCRCLTENHDPDTPIDRALCEERWLGGFARPNREWDMEEEVGEGEVMVWSEYTLYRITLDHYEVFDELHVSEQEAAMRLSSGTPAPKLHCHNVWYAGQLPWPAEEASRDTGCLFSVIQSTTGVAPSTILRLYETYIP